MPLQRLDHVLVLTDDLEATRAFYCDVLGLELAERPPLPFPGYWLCLDRRPCVHVAERGPYEAWAPELGLRAAAEPVDHLAFQGENHAELVGRVEAAGLTTVTNTIPGVLHQVFVTDPNGIRIELNVPAA